MDSTRNPFSPGAGSQPPELVGRDKILAQSLLTLARVKNGRSEKSLLLVGLRGVGKTVLLNRISQLAEEQGYKAALIEAPENKSLPTLLLPHLRRILLSLDTGQSINVKTRHALRVLKAFIGTIKVKFHEIELSIGIEPERGVADSGDLETDLSELFVAVGEAAKERGTAVAIIIDELQYVAEVELSALIMAMHRISQRALPVVLIGAGLPQLVGNAGRSKSYAERLFSYPEVGPLSATEAAQALRDPIEDEGAHIEQNALERIVQLTQGYPYFLQEWGHKCWNLAEYDTIDMETVSRATKAAIESLDKDFFRVRFDRLTPKEREYARAMAEFGPKPQRSGDIAEKLGMHVRSVAPIRSKLIKKGMIYSPAHGDTAFTVPLFDQFMKRIMPTMPKHV